MNPDFIKKLTLFVEANLSDENFGPEQLAKKLGISHSTLHRRIKQATGETISQFIRDIRLEKACTFLLNQESTISEIAYKVGFGSVTYFNRCFHERYGCSPGEYKKIELEKKKNSINENQKTNSGKRWILSLALLLIILTVLFLLNKKYSFWGSGKQDDKSIAVMPFTFSGENQDKEYMCKGIEDNISNNLSKIGDLTVVAVYESKNTSPEKIRKKLSVTHTVDGMVHQTGNNYSLFVRLVRIKNNHVEWSESYNLSDQDNYLTEIKIAQSIARKLHAGITEKEKTLILKRPTVNPEANDFYQRGKNAYNTGDLQKAEDDYRKALNHDPGFAQAYAGLARIAYDKISADDILNENNIDTVLVFADKALLTNNTLAEAYTIKGNYYSLTDREKALKQYENALQYDPNNWEAYTGLGNFYRTHDNTKAMEYYFEALKRRRGPEYGEMLGSLSFLCAITGLFEQAEKYTNLKFEYDEDSVRYCDGLAFIEEYKENFSNAIELANDGYKIDSTDASINNRIAFNSILLRNYKTAFHYYQKLLHLFSTPGYKNRNEYHRIGYAYLTYGDTITANKYFQKQIEACNKILATNENSPTSLYDLAATSAILNQQDKAYEYLRVFKEHSSMSWFLYFYMKNDPLLDKIRSETEFQQILADVKKKAFIERDNLQKWVEQHENV